MIRTRKRKRRIKRESEVKSENNDNERDRKFKRTKYGYTTIAKELKARCGEKWQIYLDNFKRNFVNDGDLKILKEANDAILEKLIPEIGPRLRWREYLKGLP